MSISEIHVGSLIRVKIGKNLILAKVVEILDGAVRVCSVANNKEFNVPQSRVQLDGEQPAPANTEPQTEQETTEPEPQGEAGVASDSAESEEPQTEAEQEPAEPEAAAQTEQEVSTAEAEQPEATVETAEPEVDPTAEAEPASVEVVPEDEGAEFTPSGEDQEDEYAINPAHESDKPIKRMSLLDAAVIVLKTSGPDHPMNCKEILEAIVDRQLWTPTPGKTPEQTLYGSIFREINTKEHPRILKSNVKGKFVIAE